MDLACFVSTGIIDYESRGIRVEVIRHVCTAVPAHILHNGRGEFAFQREEEEDNRVDVIGPAKQNVEVDLENPFAEILKGLRFKQFGRFVVKIVLGPDAEEMQAIEADGDEAANQREQSLAEVGVLSVAHVGLVLWLVWVITSPAELPLTFESGGKTLFFGYMRLFLGIEILPKQIKPERGLDETYGVALSGNW